MICHPGQRTLTSVLLHPLFSFTLKLKYIYAHICVYMYENNNQKAMMPFLTQVGHQVISCVTGPIPTQEHSKLFIFISRQQPAALIMEIRMGMAFIQSVYAYICLSSLRSKVRFFPRCGAPGREGFVSVSDRLLQISGIWETEQSFGVTREDTRVT